MSVHSISNFMRVTALGRVVVGLQRHTELGLGMSISEAQSERSPKGSSRVARIARGIAPTGTVRNPPSRGRD